MNIAMHGGLSEEMVFGLGGGFCVAFIFFIFIHYRVYNSEYYNDEYVYYSGIKKFFLYLGFIVLNFFVAFMLFFFFSSKFAVISHGFVK